MDTDIEGHNRLFAGCERCGAFAIDTWEPKELVTSRETLQADSDLTGFADARGRLLDQRCRMAGRS